MTGMNEHVDGYRTPQAARLSGASYRQLDYWCRAGLLVPSIASARGSGSQRLYSLHDVAMARIVVEAGRAGWSLRTAQRALDLLRDDLSTWDGFLVLVDDDVIATVTPGAVLDEHRSSVAWVISPTAALVAIEAALDASSEVHA